jgi:hypothetical protein
MEQMVLSYLKAKASGQLQHFQSESQVKKSQDFQKTLQNLKAEMEQFEPSQAPQIVHQTPPQQVAPQQVSPAQNMGTGAMAYPPIGPHHDTQHLLGALKLDPKSRQILNEVREGLNLSSDAEVIRMCLVLAHKTIRGLIE